jgi:flagellar assembly protein FliH
MGGAPSRRRGPEDPAAGPPDDLGAVREAARQEGFAAGYAEGLARGREEGLAQTRSALERAEAIAAAIVESRAGALDALIPRIADLVIRVAALVVRDTVAQHPEAIVPVVREAVAQVRDEDRLTVRLHPEDLAILRDAVEEIGQQVGTRIVLREDRSIARGGCLVETSRGLVDSRLESKLAVLHDLVARGGTA